MRTINVKTTKGMKEEVVYTIQDFPYNTLIPCNYRTYKKRERDNYYNIVAAFDIETTNLPVKTKEIDLKGKRKIKAMGFMYHWQLCIDNKVVFGRTWEEFTIFLNMLRNRLNLSEAYRLVIYVHNLAFEFQFMKDFIRIDEIFFNKDKKPLKIFSDGIEFRCSYYLTNMNLQKLCENSWKCIHRKTSGDLDFKVIRTPKTILTEEEDGYCYNDVRGLSECIESLLTNDTIATIPLTATGYVRRDFRDAMNTVECRNLFKKLAMNSEEFLLCKDALRGANVHANRFYANSVLPNVYSFDEQSAYIAVMMMDDFPMSKFTKVTCDSWEKLDFYTKKYCCIIDISLFGIETKNEVVIPYLSISHCTEKKGITNDNGRVMEAIHVRTAITNIDWDIIKKQYDIDVIKVHSCYYAERGKLPVEMRELLMEYFRGKCLLKDIPGKKYEYATYKKKINAVFGMIITDLLYPKIDYLQKDHKYNVEIPEVKLALDSYYNSPKSFLTYQWGIFVLAHARRRLQTAIDLLGYDCVYVDTDNTKFVGEENLQIFEELNRQIRKECKENDIPAYISDNGKEYYLGEWEMEKTALQFKTLGAKKYCKETKNGFEITVAGMNKELGSKVIGNIHNFQIGRTYKNIGRKTPFYNETTPHYITVQGCSFSVGSNVGFLDAPYTIGVSMEYWELISGNYFYLSEE